MLNKKDVKNLGIGCIESLVITALFLIASKLLHNPLFLKSAFPWIWFAPVIVALSYGLLPAILSMVFFLGVYLYFHPEQLEAIPFQMHVLGGFLLTVLCVIFQRFWKSKIDSYDKISNYLQTKIQTTADAYRIVLNSFHHLEHSLISNPVTLRSSLSELRELLARAKTKKDPEIYNRFLNILAYHCGLEAAAIFPVTKKNTVTKTSIASIGQVKVPSKDDFLINECLSREAIAYVTSEQAVKEDWSDYLIVAPLINDEHKIDYVLVVQEIPFLKLNNDNLETMNVFINYFLEGDTNKESQKILKKYPECNVDFAKELQRLTTLAKTTKRDSAVCAYYFSSGIRQEEYLFTLKQQSRGIDTVWETQVKKEPALLILMPLSDRLGIEYYETRINKLLNEKFNIQLNGKEIKFKSALLSSFKNPINLLEEMLKIT